MSGAIAVEFAGGPEVPFELGRQDTADTSSVPPNGRLPDAAQGAAHLREVFYRMGLDDREIVALSGGHTLGRCHKSRSGYDGAWTPNPLKFDNSYFVNLMSLEWTERDWEGPTQYTDPSGRYTMLPTDIAIKEDAEFKVFTELYAADEAAFFKDFASAYGKLLSLGCPNECNPAKPAGGCPFSAQAVASADFREHAMHGSIEHCRAAVEAGADVHGLEKNSGRTALHKAAFWNHAHMMDWMLDDLKIDSNVQDYNGDSALHDAARFGHAEIVQALLARGADKGLVNKDGETPQQVAASYEKQEVAALLA
eukprot:TRINITY_DN17241_c0_g1_i4.p1 TRINITY_DN17241_c0_g1~~TRINITY_DN17241_c0_g1_i4.p1  ORF type:complete len:309 (-),score=77.35 TRINITY_DN17241_c0_g1_i4:371-1297(-)